jgi:hypothetical protein
MMHDDQDLTDERVGAAVLGPVPTDSSETVMQLLAEHVPLALLADLATPDGPVSQVILETEGLPGDAWWETQPGMEPVADPGSDESAGSPEAAND